jgi:hypothetical protein
MYELGALQVYGRGCCRLTEHKGGAGCTGYPCLEDGGKGHSGECPLVVCTLQLEAESDAKAAHEA